MGLLDGDAYVSVMDPAYKPVDQRRAAMAGLLRGLLDVSPVGLLDVAKTAGAAFGNPGLARAPNPTDYAAGLLGLQRPQATAFSPSENAQRAYDFGNAVAPVAASAGGLMANALRGAPLSQVNSGAAGARRQVVGEIADFDVIGGHAGTRRCRGRSKKEE